MRSYSSPGDTAHAGSAISLKRFKGTKELDLSPALARELYSESERREDPVDRGALWPSAEPDSLPAWERERLEEFKVEIPAREELKVPTTLGRCEQPDRSISSERRSLKDPVIGRREERALSPPGPESLIEEPAVGAALKVERVIDAVPFPSASRVREPEDTLREPLERTEEKISESVEGEPELREPVHPQVSGCSG